MALILDILRPRKKSVLIALAAYLIAAGAGSSYQYYEYAQHCSVGICSSPAWAIIPYMLFMFLPLPVIAYLGCGIYLFMKEPPVK